MQLTDQQQAVVDAPKNNILVSAAAGSGKTMVLVERISSRIAAGELDIRKTLVMTFTKAAASSMIDRMEKALLKKIDETHDSDIRKRIAEQLSFLPLAQISTIHSFCTQVIREYGNEMRDSQGDLLLEPGSTVLDTALASIMLNDAVDDVLDRIFTLCHDVKVDNTKYGDVPAKEAVFGEYTDHEFVCRINRDESLEMWCGDFIKMSQCFGSASNDQELKRLLIQVYKNLRSLPDYAARMIQAVFDYQQEAEDFSRSSRARYALDMLKKTVKSALPDAECAQKMLYEIEIVKDKKANEKHQQNMQQLLNCFFRLNEALDQALDWDDAFLMGKDVPRVTWPRKSKTSEDQVVFLDHMVRVCEALYMISGVLQQKVMKNQFAETSQYFFFMSSENYRRDLCEMTPLVFRFFEIIYLIDCRYAFKKRSENSMDFSDQEQMALALLKNEEIATYYRAQYDEIYIDEYQDNSKIQDAIVSCFSKCNVFFVGDVKQSIYRFRHARPDMFMARLDQYQKETDGQLLELNGNFRSDRAIIESVNTIFTEIMSLETGEVDYDRTHMLVPMKPDQEPKEIGEQVSLVLIDVSQGKDQEGDTEEATYFQTESDEVIEDYKLTEKEGLLVAEEISKMMNATQASPADFAVLTQKNKDARQIAEMLNVMGIPAQSPEEESLFMHKELLLMQQMISLINNFRQDIPLSAIMRAPFPQSRFSCEELLSIYLFAQESGFEAAFFHEKVLYYEENGPMPLREKITNFMSFIRELKRLAVHLNVSELIEQIYLRTNYFEYLSTLENGVGRTYALEVFREWANKFERNKKGDLYAFVRFTEEIKDNERSSDECELFSKIRNAVQCMSIHKSKGLEYKNVFVCGINGKTYNRGKNDGALVFDDQNGVVCDYVLPEESYKYTPLNKAIVEINNKNAEFAEKLRLLYVAATRAEERLFFVGTIKRNKDGGVSGVDDLLIRANQEVSDKLPAAVIRNANSFLSLLLLVLFKTSPDELNALIPENTANELSKNAEDVMRPDDTSAPFKLSVISDNMLKYEKITEAEEVSERVTDKAITDDAMDEGRPDKERMEHALILRSEKEYEFEKLLHTPAKTTVSEIKRRMSLVEDEESAYNLFDPAPHKPINLQLRKESVKDDEEALSPAEKGTLLHSVFQYLDFSSFDKHLSRQTVIEQLDRLVSLNMIRSDRIHHVMPYVDSIIYFAQSSLCKRMLLAESRPRSGPFREIPFSITEKVSQDDFCLIQGMIDCWFIENGEAVLLDYKSDRIPGDENEKKQVLSDRYSVQMDYYARAIEAAGGVKVKEKWIWLIPDGLSFSF